MQSLAEKLAEGLVERLGAVIPQHITLTAEVGGVTIGNPVVVHAWCHISVDAIVEQDGDPRELVETAALSVLSGVQDFIAEDLTEPWPGDEKELPLPTIAWVGNELHVGYGTDAAASLRLPPLPIFL